MFGPITIQVWGLCVVIGILSAIIFAFKMSKKYFLSEQVMLDSALWIMTGGFVGARIFHILFYQPMYYFSNPIEVFYFWQGGASSLGGFVGAFLACLFFLKNKHFSFKDFLPYFDISILSLWLGWSVGRIGCFLIHDHIGKISNFFLAVNFPNGARHDLGLYESIFALVIFIIFACVFKKLIKIRYGLVSLFSFLIYSVGRFFLDFLRAQDVPYADARYFNLTPAQWGMMSIFAGLTIFLIFVKISQRKA